MAVLIELREELAGMLTAAGIPVSDYVPEVVNPPVAITKAGSPWVEEVFDNKTFANDYQINMEVRLVAAQASNEAATDALDDLVVAALVALRGSWESTVSEPFAYEVNGAVFLAADIRITTSITIN